MAGTDWWVLIPQGAVNESTSYKESVDFRVPYPIGSTQDTALKAGKSVVAVGGQTMVAWKGPFSTEAEAEAAQNPQPSPEGVNAVTGAAGQGLSNLLNIKPGFFQRAFEVALGGLLIYAGVRALI